VTTILDRPLPPSRSEQSDTDVAGQRGSVPARLRARFSAVPLDYRILTGLVLAIGTVQGWNILRFPALGDDEGTYLAQAWAVGHGVGLAPYTYWYDHPPLGWMQLAALSWLPAWLLPHELAVASGRLSMLAVSGLNVILLYVVARRIALPRWSAALAVLLFGLSPLAVTLQRQVYLDNIAVAWTLAAFALALSPRRHMWHHVAAGACVAVAALSKETMIVALPGVLVALWQGSHPSTRKFSWVGFACGFGLVAAFYPLYAGLNRELVPGAGHVSLVGALLFQVHGRAGSGSMLQAGSGANQLLHAWLFYDPFLPIAGALAVAVGVAIRQLRAPALAGLMLVLVAMRPGGGYLPAMYVLQAIPFFALAVAGLAAVAGRYALAYATVAPRAQTGAQTGGSGLDGRSGLGLGGRISPATRRIRLAIAGLAVAATVSVAAVVPTWYDGDRRAMTVDANRHYVTTVDWVRHHVPDLPDARIVTDDAIWLDLVRAGCRPGLGAIWFYKLDLDPAVKEALPHGWRDVDYIISTPIIRQDPNSLPTVHDLLTHSQVMATFGTGDERIEVRRVNKEQP
jgi:4-amino-4-deoxy-L-arabinose transferase-like glycosyltransferase